MESDKCLVSVVVPMFNAEKYIRECVDSARNQTLKDLEIIVVDDGSRDRSAAIVRDIARCDGRLRLLSHPKGANLGVSRTRQRGVSQAGGRYVAFLDADDACQPDRLRRQVEVMEEEPECVLCHTAVGVVSEDDDRVGRSLERYFGGLAPRMVKYRFHRRGDALDANRVCLSSTMVRTAALRRTDFSFPQLFQHEDWTLFVLLSLQGPFVFLPEPLARYRVHPHASQSRLRRDPLLRAYSRVEFLLTVIALSDDRSLAERAEARLHDTLAELKGVYSDRALAVRPVIKRQARRVRRRLGELFNWWVWRAAVGLRRVFSSGAVPFVPRRKQDVPQLVLRLPTSSDRAADTGSADKDTCPELQDRTTRKRAA